MNGAVTPEGGRRTRPALVEIPAQLGRFMDPLQTVINTGEWSPALPSGYLSPELSPDEQLIQQRGRKRLPTTWSPDMEFKQNSTFHSIVRTPPKPSGQTSRPNIEDNLRNTPRKRLLLGVTKRIPLTPDKIDFSDMSTPQKFKISNPIDMTPPTKRSRIEKLTEFHGPLDVALKGLSPTQLVNIIKTITNKHPQIEEELRKDMPVPDLAPLEERLNYLKSNIFKSLPTSRLTSKTDSPAYSSVATHLAAFKKSVIEQGKNLVESQHWESVIQYVFLAWSYVKATPVWDNQPHNMIRKHCFKVLANFCMTALKKGAMDEDFLIDVQDKLQGLVADSEDIQSCIKFIQKQLCEVSNIIPGVNTLLISI